MSDKINRREALALAFMRAKVIPVTGLDGVATLDTPDHPEARRLADVALAALQHELPEDTPPEPYPGTIKRLWQLVRERHNAKKREAQR